MAHDPTSNESESASGMVFPSAIGNAEVKAKRPPRRKLNLSDPDAALVEKTRAQIRELVEEVRKLGKGECSVNQFHEGLLSRLVMALASVGGAIWVRDQGGKSIRLECHVNLKQTSLGNDNEALRTHGKLIERMFESDTVTLIPPATGSNAEDCGSNPTDCLLILGPVEVDNEVVGVIEVFQRAGAGPATQRGYQRFVSQMCEINAEFLSRERLRSYQEQQKTWSQLERFVQQIHRKLNVSETVYAIANEGRRLIDCDRVSVATMQGNRCIVKTVSGLDTIERRSEQVKTLSRLATAVVKSKTALWYDGDDSKLPPKIESRIHDHVEQSHARLTAVLPLFKVDQPADDDPFHSAANEIQKPVGALIVEQLNDTAISPQLKQRTELVASHAQSALSNSIDHQSIFLMPLWKAIGGVTYQLQGSRLFRTATILGVIAAAVAFLCLYPYQFTLSARGNLVPEQQTEVYAKLDGILTDINVSNTGDTLVEKGHLLAKMASSTLEMKIGDLEGRIAQSREELRFASDGKNNGEDPEEVAAYSFQFQRAQQTILNLENELSVLLKDRGLLEVKAPISGQVVNWQVRQNLLRRPVRYGQHLMTIVPPDTQWLIELEMPERRLAHLSRAMEESDEVLSVTFSLLSWPGKEFRGELISVDQKLDVYSDEGNAALVKVRFSNDEIPKELIKSGTRVTGKVQCGTRSIGYALFYELIETVQSKWQFWF